MHRRVRNVPGISRGAEPASFVTEGEQLVVPTSAAAQAQEATDQDAAFEEGVELTLDELQQVGASSCFGLREESRGMLLHEAVQRCLFWAVALVVGRHAIRRPLGLPANGLRAMLPRW
jgi:hypothetical protein